MSDVKMSDVETQGIRCRMYPEHPDDDLRFGDAVIAEGASLPAEAVHAAPRAHEDKM